MIDPRIYKKTLGLKEYASKKDKILIVRRGPGLGDIMMYRMIFEDIKKLFPKKQLYFACDKKYHDALLEHPYLDHVLDVDNLKLEDFIYYFETTKEPIYSDQNKSDIWAKYCGIELKYHNMYLDKFNSSEDEVILAPISNIPNKSLTQEQIKLIVDKVKNIKVVHNKKIDGVNTISDLSLKELIQYIGKAKIVISVDTGILHIAGGMGKKTIGLFLNNYGSTICKYYKNASVYDISKNFDKSLSEILAMLE